ncbi:MAG: hypothetical protein IPM60_15765 [Rhodospirillales bacterium]|nr:hypothetical protein [Rhodospirillales bacterium]
MIGYTTRTGANTVSGHVSRISADGATIWSRDFSVGAAGNDKLQSGVRLPYGNLVFIGAASTHSEAPFKGWALQLDSNGKVLAERLFDEPGGGRFYDVEWVRGKMLVAVGAARRDGNGNVDGIVARNSIQSK